MTYAQLEAGLQTCLGQLYDAGEADAIADLVLEEITGYKRSRRRQIGDTTVEAEIRQQSERIKLEFLQHKPVQYVLGHAWFCGMKFLVNEHVLIPRPETEELVEWITDFYKNNEAPFQILDIGTGSGCIAIALRKKLPGAIVAGLDVSREALALAEKNALKNETKVDFLQLDFLSEDDWKQSGKYDIIVSNPPYVPAGEKQGMDKTVTGWEPGLALFVPDNEPLLFYKKIAAFAKTHLLSGGAIFMEIHQQFAGKVQQLFIEQGYEAKLRKDINGNDRMVRAFNREW